MRPVLLVLSGLAAVAVGCADSEENEALRTELGHTRKMLAKVAELRNQEFEEAKDLRAGNRELEAARAKLIDELAASKAATDGLKKQVGELRFALSSEKEARSPERTRALEELLADTQRNVKELVATLADMQRAVSGSQEELFKVRKERDKIIERMLKYKKELEALKKQRQ